jgi:hypothetical protein
MTRKAAAQERQRRAGTAKARLATEGGYPGGPLPYALRLDAWGRWERDPDEVKILKRIASYRARGTSINHIANRLNLLEIPAPKGGAWAPSTVLRLLMNPLYYRRVEDIPPTLEGHARERAEHNYRTTGILANYVSSLGETLVTPPHLDD